MAKPAHRAQALAANVASKHRLKAVPPQPYSLVAHVDTALEQ